jgi:cytoskeleton protein RodZ
MTPEKAAPKDFLGLRTKREASGITLKDISDLTRVSVVNLEAIENGEFPDLPVPVYTKSFIKNYARVLDLDSKPILDSYEAYLASLKTIQTPLTGTEPPKEPLIKRLVPYKKYIAVISIIIIVTVITLFILQQQQPGPSVAIQQPHIIATAPPAAVTTPLSPPEQATPIAQATQAKTAVQPVVVEAIKQPQVPPAQQKSTASVKTLPKQNLPAVEKKAPVLISEGNDVLVIKATEETWLRMKIDENPSFQVFLKPGEEIARKGAGFTMDIGNAGGIKIQFKGEVIENLGKSGEVVHLKLP